jgi:hypothetical protein
MTHSAKFAGSPRISSIFVSCSFLASILIDTSHALSLNRAVAPELEAAFTKAEKGARFLKVSIVNGTFFDQSILQSAPTTHGGPKTRTKQIELSNPLFRPRLDRSMISRENKSRFPFFISFPIICMVV